MRNLAKYFLALAVMGGGFYAAQQHRLPNGNAPRGTAAMHEPTVEPSSSGGQRLPAATSPPPSPTPLPVAALADVDRVPLLGPDRPKTPGRSTLPETASVTKQPTLRGEGVPDPPSSADSAKISDSDAADVDSKKQAEVKSKPKKQNPKKGAKTADRDRDKDRGQDRDFVPPELAHEYRPFADSFETGHKAGYERDGEPEPQKAASASSTSSAQVKPWKPSSTATPRRHRIAEGDTLARLAEKYLGSRDRSLDLFQANADVLFDPRLIPIGVEIVIPDRTTAVAQAAATPATFDGADDNPAPPSSTAPDSR
jgi:hypothetical protein